MDIIQGIINVCSPSNLLYCFIGCVLGTLVGVLPGLGPPATLSILLPLTMFLDPTGSIIMMAGLYYGAQYGGSTTSILINIPGEVSSVPTSFDGYQMTLKGKAGQALWMAAVSSFIAGTIGTLLLSFIGPGIAKYALKFGPPEYFGLVFFSMTILLSLSGSSITKGLATGMVGIILSTIGVDPLTGVTRFTFGSTSLMRGFDLIPILVGLFGIGEILTTAEEGRDRIYSGKIERMTPPRKDIKRGLLASIRGTIVGFPLGVLPGMLPGLTSFLAYDLEKRISKNKRNFGKGAIEGVAAPEAANNATAQAGFIPIMTLGIPTSPSTAIILAALMIVGLQPGPVLFETNKDFIWTVIGSMYVGNLLLLILNLPLVGLWARISLIPYKYLAPIVLGISVIGAYSTRNTMFDVWVALGAGILGYLMRKGNWPIAPFILGIILGPMLEQSLRQSLSMGGITIFFHRPVCIFFILLALAMVTIIWRYLKKAGAQSGADPV